MNRYEHREFLIASHLRLIDGMIEYLKTEKGKRCDKKDCLQAYCLNRKIRNQTIKDQITYLQSEKENIINSLTPKGDK